MPLARTFAMLLLIAAVASCISRADVPVNEVDERAVPTGVMARAEAPQKFNTILDNSDDIAWFTATATTRAKATSANLHTRFSSREPSGPSSPGSEVTVTDAAPIIAALLKSGIPERTIRISQHISVPDHESSIPGVVDIDVSLRNTDPSYVRSLGKAINDADGYPVYHAFSDVTFRIDDCTSLFARARQAAFDGARAQAARAAQRLHSKLGPIANVHEVSLAVTEGSCGSMSPTAGSTPVYRNGQFEIANGGYVTATARLSAAFRLGPRL